MALRLLGKRNIAILPGVYYGAEKKLKVTYISEVP